ncbi:hypothetical protein C8Q70DRAFT_946545 [Cubamyces menziesii]|nr:hypothetical protein C8Q70DRAFT_946545 [Cubamyces menziesii]
MSAKNPSPKKVDVHLPGPSPKRPKHEASESASAKKPVSRARKGAHSRAGSVASIAREDTIDANDMSPTKPISSASTKPRSQIAQRTETPEDGADDRSSIGESSKMRIRKTEAERRQFLEEDPNSGDVEPHRVFCKACDGWVDLNPKLKYIMRLWLEHRKQCKGTPVESPSPSKDKEGQDVKVADEAAEDDNVSVAATSAVDGGHKRVAKEEDRKAILEADSRISELKPDAAYCKDCQKWVKLSPNTRYSLYHWRVHTQKCGSGVPSSRVATAQRKLKLVNDPHVKAFTPRSVDCKLCDTTVELERTAEYDLTKWEDHKLTVHGLDASTTEASASTAKPAESASTGSPRPPPSTASTEETVVANESSPPRQGTKRAREDDDDVPDRSVRQRGASYEPPAGDNPGFLNWLVAPVKNFIRGFREGLAG